MTSLTYPCGCSAYGWELPTYCPEHGHYDSTRVFTGTTQRTEVLSPPATTAGNAQEPGK